MTAVKRIIAIIAIILGLAGLTVGAFFLLYQPEPEGIVIGISTLPDSLNPVLKQNIWGLNSNELVFDGLVNYQVDPQSATLYPEFALADYIEQDLETKRIYTVGLKAVTWHDGRALSADDVVYSFNAYMDLDNDSPQRAYLSSFIEGVSKVDDMTVAITFNKPIPEFRAYPILTFKIIPSVYNGQPMSTKLRDGELERQFATKPIGTGPFKVDQWEIGKWVTFKANETYFAGVPGSQDLVLRNIIDPVLRMNEFQKKKINLILETSPLDRASVEKMDQVQISSFMPYAYYQVVMNTKRPALASDEARRALAASIKADALVPGITDNQDLSIINLGPFPSDIMERNFAAYNPAPLGSPWTFDTADAVALLPSTDVAKANLGLLYPDSMGEFGQLLADAIVAQYKEMGVTMEAKRTGDQVFRRLVEIEKDFDLALQYNDGFDNLFSDTYLYFQSTGSRNVSGLADQELDTLFDAWNNAVETEDWINLTRSIHSSIGNLAPIVPLFSVKKDVYSRGIDNIVIASDNPFLSSEHWVQVAP